MSGQLLMKHRFKGKRFDDNGIDIDVLPELLAYKKILIETTKALWRKQNPIKQKLPDRFGSSIVLKFYEIEGGCVSIPIHVIQETPDEKYLPGFQMVDLIKHAVNIIADTCENAGNNQPLPEDCPKSIIPLFNDYGKTLRDDESFEHIIEQQATPVQYTSKSRENLLHLIEKSYEDSIEIIGEVTMASVRKNQVGITLENRKEIEASFELEDEEIIISALKDHAIARLRVIGQGQFSGIGQLEKIIKVDRFEFLPSGERPFDPDAKPIWEVFDEIMADISEDVLDALPRDGASELDHYIYGKPKRKK